MSRHPFASASPTAIAEPVTGTASSPPTAASTTSAPARSANPTPDNWRSECSRVPCQQGSTFGGVNARETLTAHQALAPGHVILRFENQRLRPECNRGQTVSGIPSPTAAAHAALGQDPGTCAPMTIRFAAASGTAPVPPCAVVARGLARRARERAANDNGPGNDARRKVSAYPEAPSEEILRAALRHFAEHGLGAARAARIRAEAAFFAGDRQAYRWWLEITRTLDRRLAAQIGAAQIVDAPERRGA